MPTCPDVPADQTGRGLPLNAILGPKDRHPRSRDPTFRERLLRAAVLATPWAQPQGGQRFTAVQHLRRLRACRCDAGGVTLRFDRLKSPDDAAAAVEFLTTNEWPFHSVPRPSPAEAATVIVTAHDIVTFWMRDGGEIVGMIRILDLDDLDVGSPLFDLRIAEQHRGRGLGRQAVRWLTDYLFGTYSALHRIEAATRDDNLAMQRVFAHCGYRLEGRFLEAWRNADGSRSDTLTYAVLRREWARER